MRSRSREPLMICAVAAAILAAVIALALLLKSAQCHSHYADYGETSYRPVAGCMVKHNGKWKPSTVFREVTP